MATAAQEQLQFAVPKFEMSSTIGQIVDALAKARKVFKPVIKDKKNPFFKSMYADLDSLIDATKDGLSDNGLAIIQAPAYEQDGVVRITTFLAHSSGEWFKSILDVPLAKVDAQGVGAGTTYGRRYAYGAMVNVASEEDDDANGAVTQPFKKADKPAETDAEFDQRTEGERNIAPFQITAIDQACKRTGKTEAEVLAYLNLIGEKRIEHIKRNQFDAFLKWANSTTKPTVKPVTKGLEATREAANKRLWALAAEHSIPEGDIKKCAYEKYNVASMRELTTEQLIDMAQWVTDVAAAVAEQ